MPLENLVREGPDRRFIVNDQNRGHKLPLQSPICCCDKPASGRLTLRSLNVGHDYATRLPGSVLAIRIPDFATNRHGYYRIVGSGVLD